MVDLSQLLQEVVRLYQTRFRQRGAQVLLEVQPTPPAFLFEGELRQVLNNLVRNAHDAMPHGGTLHIRLRPAASLRTGIPGLRLTIADTGIGFLPAMRQHLFEPFHTSKGATGTGLGLWISKGIMDKHGGAIALRSTLATSEHPDRHGTVFALWLPLEQGK